MRTLLLLLAGAAVAVGQDAAPAEPDGGAAPAREPVAQKTVSKSRQFVIHGSDFVTRGAVATLAEETRDNLAAELGEDRQWEHSIAIQLHGAQGDPVRARALNWRAFQVPGGFRLQLDVHLARGKPSGLEAAILELLLIERGLRNRGAEGLEGGLAIPAWLLDGFLESFRWRRGERDRDLYATLFEDNQLFPVGRLLEIEEAGGMDAMTRAAFRGSSGALVMALLGQPGGKEAMNALLSEAATFEGDEMLLLTRHFPGMNLGRESFAKWWALQLARMSETPFSRVLPIVATEQEIERLLVVRFKDPGGKPLSVGPAQFRDLLALPAEDRRKALLPVVERTGVLLYRAFPAHREIIAEYLRILGEISNGTDNDLDARLENLAARRRELLELGKRTRDYLDWFRITNAQQLSGDFESYMQLKESLDAPRTRRDGPISQYLDDMQRVIAGQ